MPAKKKKKTKKKAAKGGASRKIPHTTVVLHPLQKELLKYIGSVTKKDKSLVLREATELFVRTYRGFDYKAFQAAAKTAAKEMSPDEAKDFLRHVKTFVAGCESAPALPVETLDPLAAELDFDPEFFGGK